MTPMAFFSLFCFSRRSAPVGRRDATKIPEGSEVHCVSTFAKRHKLNFLIFSDLHMQIDVSALGQLVLGFHENLTSPLEIPNKQRRGESCLARHSFQGRAFLAKNYTAAESTTHGYDASWLSMHCPSPTKQNCVTLQSVIPTTPFFFFTTN
jgi:hypothetical protein